MLLRLAGFRWAAESLRLRRAAPELTPEAITRMVQDLKKVVPEGEHATVLEAGIAHAGRAGRLGGDPASCSSRSRTS